MTFEHAIDIGQNNRAEEIKTAHAEGMNAMKGSLSHFAKAGKILCIVQQEVESFPKWCEENLPFSRKTAYQYIRLNSLVESGQVCLESGKFTSLRQCLGIDHDGEKSTYQAKMTDKRFESIPSMAAKMEKFWQKGVSKRPVEDMTHDEKRALKKSLSPLVKIYKSL